MSSGRSRVPRSNSTKRQEVSEETTPQEVDYYNYEV